jgi:alpha-beta hydrolase superfamily lysophospholipase
MLYTVSRIEILLITIAILYCKATKHYFQGIIMSSFAIDLPSHAGVMHTYANRVGIAARAFLAALLAVEPRQPVEGEVRETAASRRAKVKNIMMLNRMAEQYDSVSPNFSAELRFFASRG